MVKIIVILCLSALSLVQVTNALPTAINVPQAEAELKKDLKETLQNADKKAHSDSSEESNNVKPKVQLLVGTLLEFYGLSKTTLIEGKKVLTDVIKDVSATESKTDKLQAEIDTISTFLKKVDKIEAEQDNSDENSDEATELFNAVTDFSDLVDKYNTTVSNGTEIALIETSLKKNGIDQLEKNFLQRFETFTETFNTAVKEYIANLSEEEKVNETKLINWHKEFKNEKDETKKVELFGKFFDSFTD